MVARNRKQKKNNKAVVKRPAKPRALNNYSMATDAYSALLANPCTGPMVGPIGATQKGYITRFEKTFMVPITYGAGNTTTCFGLRWTPGIVDPNTTQSDTLDGRVEGVASATLGSVWLTNDESPGFAFLQSTATSARCLAACAQFTYTGTELNRQGVLGSFISDGSRLVTTASADQLNSLSVSRSRVMDGMFEVVWKPNDYDVNFSHFNSSATPEQRAKHSALWVSGVQLSPISPANASIMVRLVAVYEWTPGTDDGIIVPTAAPGSGETLATAVRNAYARGARFGELMHHGYNTYKSVRNAVAGVGAYAYGLGRTAAPLLLTM